MAKPKLDDFRVPYFNDKNGGKDVAKHRFELASYDCSAKPLSTGSKDGDKQALAELGVELDTLQDRMHSQTRERVLLVLQGMDTSGKDGTIRAVFHEVDPLGLRIAAFRAPTLDEAAHDFLWRVHRYTPAGGELAVFNRSHYEDVLVPRVLGTLDDKAVRRRYEHIRAFESLLVDSHTTIVKCFLHISKDEQRDRLQARVDDPTKHWKFDPSDLDARKQWDDYQLAYEDALAATSTPEAPWYVIPANSKSHRNLMVATILADTMRKLDLEYPPSKVELEGLKVL
jgi:PPK2 family polyphosphate:nucleotide phosphotransferase